MNEDLQNLMSKSKTNQLDSDGLTTLKYKKIQEKNLPLYTWILVDLPKVNNNLNQMVIDNGNELGSRFRVVFYEE